MDIYGYKIVSSAETWNFDGHLWNLCSEQVGRFPIFHYGGFCRTTEWPAIDEKFWSGNLPSNISALYHKVAYSSEDVLGLNVVTTKNDLRILFEYVKEVQKAPFEAIVIASHVHHLGNSRETIEKDQVRWLGYEPFAVREWALIKVGIVYGNNRLNHWVSRTNSFGLFDDENTSQMYSEEYKNVMGNGGPEEIALDPNLGIFPIRIGLLDI